MFGDRSRVLFWVCAMMLIAGSASAQFPVQGSIAGGGYFLNLNTEEATGEQRLSGFGFGGDGSLAFRRLGLGIRYMEGSLSPSDAGRDRSIVEGELMLSVRAFSWLRIGFGPHVRSLIIPEGTERWFFWEGRIQAKTRLGSPRLVSVFEFWQVISADVDVDDPFDSGQGIEGGLRWEFSSLPFWPGLGYRPVWLGLGYRIDRSKLGNGSRTEVMEHLLISVGVGRGAN